MADSANKQNNRSIGTLYEDKACEYLQSCGYTLLSRNFRTRRGEIDIIAFDKETLVFVEVKYRKTYRAGYPEDAVGISKQRTIFHIAQVFMTVNHYPQGMPCRFDVICLDGYGNLRHYKNAFGGI